MINTILFITFNIAVFAVIYWAWKSDNEINSSKSRAVKNIK